MDLERNSIRRLDIFISILNILRRLPFISRWAIGKKVELVSRRTILHFGLKPIERKRKTVVFDKEGKRLPSQSGLYVVEFVTTEDFDQKYDPDEHASK